MRVKEVRMCVTVRCEGRAERVGVQCEEMQSVVKVRCEEGQYVLTCNVCACVQCTCREVRGVVCRKERMPRRMGEGGGLGYTYGTVGTQVSTE